MDFGRSWLSFAGFFAGSPATGCSPDDERGVGPAPRTQKGRTPSCEKKNRWRWRDADEVRPVFRLRVAGRSGKEVSFETASRLLVYWNSAEGPGVGRSARRVRFVPRAVLSRFPFVDNGAAQQRRWCLFPVLGDFFRQVPPDPFAPGPPLVRFRFSIVRSRPFSVPKTLRPHIDVLRATVSSTRRNATKAASALDLLFSPFGGLCAKAGPIPPGHGHRRGAHCFPTRNSLRAFEDFRDMVPKVLMKVVMNELGECFFWSCSRRSRMRARSAAKLKQPSSGLNKTRCGSSRTQHVGSAWLFFVPLTRRPRYPRSLVETSSSGKTSLFGRRVAGRTRSRNRFVNAPSCVPAGAIISNRPIAARNLLSRSWRGRCWSTMNGPFSISIKRL